jgi:hypothetical protein
MPSLGTFNGSGGGPAGRAMSAGPESPALRLTRRRMGNTAGDTWPTAQS